MAYYDDDNNYNNKNRIVLKIYLKHPKCARRHVETLYTVLRYQIFIIFLSKGMEETINRLPLSFSFVFKLLDNEVKLPP